MPLTKKVNADAGYPEPLYLSDETWALLGRIAGDTGENEGADDVIKRIAKYYLSKVPRNNPNDPYLPTPPSWMSRD